MSRSDIRNALAQVLQGITASPNYKTVYPYVPKLAQEPQTPAAAIFLANQEENRKPPGGPGRKIIRYEALILVILNDVSGKAETAQQTFDALLENTYAALRQNKQLVYNSQVVAMKSGEEIKTRVFDPVMNQQMVKLKAVLTVEVEAQILGI